MSFKKNKNIAYVFLTAAFFGGFVFSVRAQEASTVPSDGGSAAAPPKMSAENRAALEQANLEASRDQEVANEAVRYLQQQTVANAKEQKYDENTADGAAEKTTPASTQNSGNLSNNSKLPTASVSQESESSFLNVQANQLFKSNVILWMLSITSLLLNFIVIFFLVKVLKK